MKNWLSIQKSFNSYDDSSYYYLEGCINGVAIADSGDSIQEILKDTLSEEPNDEENTVTQVLFFEGTPEELIKTHPELLV